uniref:Uncharacterized protein n=1 Tax=Vespula pensylvanica TaxID=30213 RepID=A0A834PEF2_VESPE|nr:hypothetical protein H0235_000027 [Vespula pensylvanica]
MTSTFTRTAPLIANDRLISSNKSHAWFFRNLEEILKAETEKIGQNSKLACMALDGTEGGRAPSQMNPYAPTDAKKTSWLDAASLRRPYQSGDPSSLSSFLRRTIPSREKSRIWQELIYEAIDLHRSPRDDGLLDIFISEIRTRACSRPPSPLRA